MTTPEAIKKQQQKVARLERHLAREKIKQRKRDTRRKIELGGLVIKANMDKFSKAVVLGALIDAFENLQQSEAAKTLLQSKGEAAFMGYGDDKNG